MDYSINSSGIITRIADGACIPVAPGNMDYEAYLKWVSKGNVAEPETQAQAEIVRQATRAALRQQWDTLPAWINGPHRPLFDAANHLLDEGSDEAAFEMIDAVEPTAKILNDPATHPELGGATRAQYFAAVKAQFLSVIQNL